MLVGVINGFKDDHADERDRNDVIVGKAYRLELSHTGDWYFYDESGQQNYGCDDVNDSVYEFTITDVKED